MVDLAPPSLDKLESLLGRRWAAIRSAQVEAERVRKHLNSVLSSLPTNDTSCVAFGSLARKEWTSGSDLDWTLLVDGQVDPGHSDLVLAAKSKLSDEGYKEPGRGGLFGRMAFSHTIVHQIGGEDDSNRNVTQRILLLSESVPIGGSAGAYERVIKAVVRRYIEDDPSFRAGAEAGKAPRFLLNDIVRYWRTMAVDYAHKVRDRGGDGWALRNIKLRMSRKLIFASGLLKCFLCAGWEAVEKGKTADRRLAEDLLLRLVRLTPLETLALSARCFQVDDEIVRNLLDAYDEFLALLNDEEKRDHLAKLPQDEADDDKVFGLGKDIAHRFEGALQKMFFDCPDRLRALTRHYGIF